MLVRSGDAKYDFCDTANLLEPLSGITLDNTGDVSERSVEAAEAGPSFFVFAMLGDRDTSVEGGEISICEI